MSTTSDAVAVEVPDIGDFEDVPIIEILVSPGDTVAVDDPLLTLESDKATMDVPAPFPGTVRELLVKVGDKVSQGVKLLTLSPSGDGDGDGIAGAAPPPATGGTKAADAVESATRGRGAGRASRADRGRCGAPAPPAPGARAGARTRQPRRRPATAAVRCTPAPPCGGSRASSASTCIR